MSRICTRFLLSAALIPCNVVWVVDPLFAQQESPSAQTSPSSAAQTSTQQSSPESGTQQSSESGTLVIRKSVHRVILDVVVTDSNEKPVHGLTREDFSVDEDGRPQHVLSFDVHDFNEAELPPEVPPLPQNTFMNVPTAPERGPLNVILYDMVNMKMDDQGAARKQLLNFVGSIPNGSRFAIFVLSDGLRLVQGFTSDRRTLSATLDPKTPRTHVPRIFLYGERYGQGNISLIRWAFTEIAHFLEPLPGHKNVIWFTGSLPATFLPGADASTGGYTEAFSYNDEIKEAIDAMARSQVAVYPVDVRGVALTHVRANPGGVASSDSVALYAGYATEDEIAVATGGHAFYSNNDLKDALTAATETGSSYYTLSYSPTNQNYDGQLRKLRVELSKHGYHLAYRRAYYGYNPDLPAPPRGNRRSDPSQPPAVRDSLFANMQHGAPLTHDLLFKAHIRPVGAPARATQEQMANLISGQPEYFRTRGKKGAAKPLLPIQLQTYAIDYTVEVDHPAANVARTQPFTMEVAAAAFDGDGIMLNGSVEHAGGGSIVASLGVPSAGVARSGVASSGVVNSGEGLRAAASPSEGSSTRKFHRAQQMFDVPVNAKSIRVAVRDVSTDRVGAMEVSLPLGGEPQSRADAPMTPEQAASPEAAPPKPD